MEPEEELPQPRRHRDLPRRQRLRVDLGVGALLLGALAVGAALIHHDAPVKHGTSSAHPTATPPGLNVATDFVTVTPGPGGAWLPRPASGPVRCPEDTECITAAIVASPVRDAVQDAFPGATITKERTVRLYVKNYGDALTGLDVSARQGDRHVRLWLRGAPRTDLGRETGSHAGSVLVGGHRIVSYESPLAQYDVVVEVVAPADEHVSLAPLAQLASDVRLLHRY